MNIIPLDSFHSLSSFIAFANLMTKNENENNIPKP